MNFYSFLRGLSMAYIPIFYSYTHTHTHFYCFQPKSILYRSTAIIMLFECVDKSSQWIFTLTSRTQLKTLQRLARSLFSTPNHPIDLRRFLFAFSLLIKYASSESISDFDFTMFSSPPRLSPPSTEHEAC